MTKEQLIALLNDMSLEEKVNQMSQVIGGFFDDDTVITGPMAEMGFTEENIELSGPGEVSLIMITANNIIGENRIIATTDPKISINRFTTALNVLVSGT